MKAVFFTMLLFCSVITNFYAQGGCDAQFEEKNGMVIMEIESVELAGDWVKSTSIDGFTGDAYYTWNGSNQFNSPGKGLLEFKIQIHKTGTYRFQWRSRITIGDDHTEHNDSWLRFTDAADFYGKKGDHIIYPGGTGKSPTPNGSSKNGWFKIYMNQENKWSWSTNTSDHDAHEIYVEFDQAGVYTMQISGRSKGHGIDRIAMYHSSVSSNTALDEDQPETLCNSTTDVTSIPDSPLEKVVIFPNPSSLNTRTIGITSKKRIEGSLVVLSSLGQMLNAQNQVIEEGENQFQLDLTSLEKGFYWVQLLDKENAIVNSLRLVKL